jgi:hypothetical protein
MLGLAESPTVRSSMPSPSGKDLQKLKTASFPVIGRDLLSGTKNSHIATLVERHSRFTILVKVPGRYTATVVAALSRQVR